MKQFVMHCNATAYVIFFLSSMHKGTQCVICDLFPLQCKKESKKERVSSCMQHCATSTCRVISSLQNGITYCNALHVMVMSHFIPHELVTSSLHNICYVLSPQCIRNKFVFVYNSRKQC